MFGQTNIGARLMAYPNYTTLVNHKRRYWSSGDIETMQLPLDL